MNARMRLICCIIIICVKARWLLKLLDVASRQRITQRERANHAERKTRESLASVKLQNLTKKLSAMACRYINSEEQGNVASSANGKKLNIGVLLSKEIMLLANFFTEFRGAGLAHRQYTFVASWLDVCIDLTLSSTAIEQQFHLVSCM